MQLQLVGRSAATRTALCALFLTGTLVSATALKAEDDASESLDPRVRVGFEIAPVPLDVRGKDRALVGLGSYFVNAVASCNDCHTQSATSE